MAKNLIQCLSPTTIGLKVDPSYPARSGSTQANYPNTYRTNTGAKILESGDPVRLGGLVGVVTVDHVDNLEGKDTSPVINFGLNVWEFDVHFIAAKTSTIDAGADIYFCEGNGVDNDKGFVLLGVEATTDLPTAAMSDISGLIDGTAGNTVTYRKCGTLVKDLAPGLIAGANLKGHVLLGTHADNTATTITFT